MKAPVSSAWSLLRLRGPRRLDVVGLPLVLRLGRALTPLDRLLARLFLLLFGADLKRPDLRKGRQLLLVHVCLLPRTRDRVCLSLAVSKTTLNLIVAERNTHDQIE